MEKTDLVFGQKAAKKMLLKCEKMKICITDVQVFGKCIICHNW